MASWGLAYEYGKNHYEDSWAKQEQNDRLQEERKLFDLKLAEDIAAQQTATKENSRVRDLRESMVEYGDKMKAGGAQGRKAFIDFMKTVGLDYVDLGNGKVGVSDGKGGVDQSSIIDMSNWNGDQIMSEAAKSVNTHRAEADIFKAQQEKNQDRADKMKMTEMTLQNQYNIAKMNNEAANYRAGLQAKTALAAASIRASSGGMSSSGGAGGGSINRHWDDDSKLKSLEMVAQKTRNDPTISVAIDKDTGAPIFYSSTTDPESGLVTRQEVAIPNDQLVEIQNAANRIYNDAANFTYQNGGDQYNATLSFGSMWAKQRDAGITSQVNGVSSLVENTVENNKPRDYGLSYPKTDVDNMYSYGTNVSSATSSRGWKSISNNDITSTFNASPTNRGLASMVKSFNYN